MGADAGGGSRQGSQQTLCFPGRMMHAKVESLTSMHLPEVSAPSDPAHSRHRLGSAESQRTQLLTEHLLQPPPYATKPSLHSEHCAGPSGQLVQAGLEQLWQRPREGPYPEEHLTHLVPPELLGLHLTQFSAHCGRERAEGGVAQAGGRIWDVLLRTVCRRALHNTACIGTW
jgi:hypothetical protein